MASEKLFEKLKALLEASFVLTPGSDGYEKSLVRWSDAAQKKAVRSMLAVILNK